MPAITMSRTKKKIKVPAGYDSKLEYELHHKELKDWEYHPYERIEYITPASYEPDFILESGRKILLAEVKGRFRTREEASKYIHIRKAVEENGYKGKAAEVIFIFQDSKKPMPFVRKRKDGTKQTHGEWAEKNNFRYQCCKKGLTKWKM